MATQPWPSRNNLLTVILLALCAVTIGCSSSSDREPPITTPEPFTFESNEQADFDTWVVSEPITITGITGPAPISVEAGEFAIDGGTFADTAATVENNQTVTVRVHSPIKAEETASAILTVGNQSATFNITTGPDTTPPEVTIHFPPPASMTEGDTIFMRGSVRDVHGRIESLSIEGHDVEVELTLNEAGDEGVWQVIVPIDDGLNILNVTAEDAVGNHGSETGIQITQAPITSAFPDNEVPFSTPTGITISSDAGSATAYVVETFAGPLIAVDLTTGQRRIVSSNDTQADQPFVRPMYITEGDDNLLYIGDRRGGQIYVLNKVTGERSLLNLEIIEEFDDDTFDLTSIDYDHERHLIYAAKGPYIFSINPINGNMTVLATMPSTDIRNLEGLTIDASNQVVLSTNTTPNEAVSISVSEAHVELINTGNFTRSPIFGSIDIKTEGEAYVVDRRDQNILYYADIYGGQDNPIILGQEYDENQISQIWDLSINSIAEYLLATDINLKGIIAVDTLSGRRVILSKSEVNQ